MRSIRLPLPLRFLLALSLLCFFVSLAAADPISTSTLPDPTTAPIAAVSSVVTITSAAGWPFGLLVGAYLVLEVLVVLSRETAFASTLGKGRRTIMLAGGVTVTGAAINAFAGGSWLAAAFAAVAAASTALATWHPLDAQPTTKKSESGIFHPRLSLLVGFALAPLMIGGALLVQSCSGVQRAAELGALEACGQNDAGPIISQVGSAASTALATTTSLSAAADAFAAAIASAPNLITLGADVVDCIIDVIKAARAATVVASGSGNSSAVMARLADDPMLGMLRAFRAKHPRGSGRGMALKTWLAK